MLTSQKESGSSMPSAGFSSEGTSCESSSPFKELPSIGGQAIMEGVMMNGRTHYTASVRREDGELFTEVFSKSSLLDKHPKLSVFMIRGVIRFVESLVIGYKTMSYSADIFMEEPGEEKDIKNKKRFGDAILTGGTVLLALLLAVGLFVFLPVALSRLIFMNLLSAPYLLGLMEGLFRMIIFLLYLLLVSRIKDIARVFEYHGAEHKTINCFESGEALTVENVRRASRFHKRCGTSFLFIIMLVNILVFSLIPATDPVVRFVLHLILIPVIAGLSYEVLRLSSRSDSRLIACLVAPGLWIQRITTKEPDDSQIETGIASVKALLKVEYPELASSLGSDPA